MMLKVSLLCVFIWAQTDVGSTLTVNSVGCGSDRQCLSYPDNCLLSFSTCTAFASWQVSPSRSDYLEVNLYVKIEDPSKKYWVAMATDFDKEPRMADNPAIVCYQTTAGQQIASTYTLSYKPSVLSSTGPILSYFSEKSTASDSGSLRCRVLRRFAVNDGTNQYDINRRGNKYFILGAYGLMMNDTLMQKHTNFFHTTVAAYLAKGTSNVAPFALILVSTILSIAL